MAFRHRGGFRSTSPAMRLNKTWCRLGIAGTTLTTSQAILASCVLGATGVAKGTHLRARGEVLLTATSNAAGDSDVIGLGICIVSETAGAVGGLSVPGPIADEDADFWIWHQYTPLRAIAASAADDTAIGTIARVVIDSKAMRKFVPDQRIILVGELTTGSFATVNVLGGVGFLLRT